MRSLIHTETRNNPRQCENALSKIGSLSQMLTTILFACSLAACGFADPLGSTDEPPPVSEISVAPVVTADAAYAAPSSPLSSVVETAALASAANTTVLKPASGSSTGAAPAGNTSATTAQAVVKINSVATIVSDMMLENDSRLDGIPNFLWATGPNPAAVLMGADPRGSKMHSWWLNMPNVRAEYKDRDLWTAYVQWFLIFEGVGNNARNVRVEIRNPRTYYLSRSANTWQQLGGNQAGSGWFQATKSNLLYVNSDVNLRTSADGSVAIRVPLASPNVYHGVWAPGKIDIASVVGDFSALFATVQARLVVDDPALPDDRSQANLLLHVGGDYYPDMNANANNSFPPGAGVSRVKRITSQWQSFSFATIDSARQDYVGASASISTDAFRRNPPPLE